MKQRATRCHVCRTANARSEWAVYIHKKGHTARMRARFDKLGMNHNLPYTDSYLLQTFNKTTTIITTTPEFKGESSPPGLQSSQTCEKSWSVREPVRQVLKAAPVTCFARSLCGTPRNPQSHVSFVTRRVYSSGHRKKKKVQGNLSATSKLVMYPCNIELGRELRIPP